jgi:hypothetical protein
MYRRFAEAGIAPSRIDEMVKSGALPSIISPGGMAKFVGAVALLTGIPAGIIAHMFHRRVRDDRHQEKEMKQRISYYRDASQGLEQGLATSGAQV